MTRLRYLLLAALAALVLLRWLGRRKETASVGWQHRTLPPYEPEVTREWHPGTLFVGPRNIGFRNVNFRW